MIKPISRRTFLDAAMACAGAGAVLAAVRPCSGAAAPPAAASAAPRMPVVGFHMDRPYLDPTGLAQPYIPPAGTRSGQPLAELSDEAFLSRFPC